MTAKDSEIVFIQNKIMDIRYAKFSTDITPEFCIFNNVIKTIKFDSDGYIWFFTSCKGECAKNITGNFLLVLTTIKKGEIFIYILLEKHQLLKPFLNLLMPK